MGVAGTLGAIKLNAPSGPLVKKETGQDAVEIEIPRNNGFVDEMTYFFDCIRRDVKPESNGYDGRRVVAVALAAHQSAQSGVRELVAHWNQK
ncbi:MAG TPA: hypothetical protein DIU35_10045 [Candidatus Latescibacteria bacterium]|nr:hypothetical protein [Candidatus Latescibacterota bacterium]